MTVSIREFDDYFAFLEARTEELGLTNKQLAQVGTPPKTQPKTPSWARKMRTQRVRPPASELGRLAGVLQIEEPDLEFWHALHRAGDDDPIEQAEARGYLWAHGHPSLIRMQNTEATEWLLRQPLDTWIVAHLARAPDATAKRILARMRRPLPQEDVEALLTQLRQRNVLGGLTSPHIQPHPATLHLEAHRLASTALSDRWEEHKQVQNVTLVAGSEVREAIDGRLHLLAEQLKGFASEEPGPVMVATLHLTPLSQTITATAAAPPSEVESATDNPTSLATPIPHSWENPTGVAWEEVVKGRLQELGMSMEELGTRIGKTKGWVSRALGLRISIHSGEPDILTRMTDAMEYETDNERLEFTQLARFIHPNAQVRHNALKFIQERLDLDGSLAILRDLPQSTPLPPHWFEIVLQELHDAGVAPSDPSEVARLFHPPIAHQQALSAIRRLRSPSFKPRIARETTVTSPDNDVRNLKKLQWQLALERIWAHQAASTFVRTVIVPIPPQRFRLARERAQASLQEIVSLVTAAPLADTVRAYHLGSALLEVAE